MTPQQFQTYYLPYAQTAAQGTGLSPYLFLAQWSVETAYAEAFAGSHNLGNITRGGAQNGFVNYGSYGEFVQAEILLLHDIPYEGVLASGGKSLYDQCVALGESPWDAGHYSNGSGPGSSLIAVLPLFGLTEGDINPMTAQEHQWLEFLFNDLIGGTVDNPTGNLGKIVAELAALKAEVDALKAALPTSTGAGHTFTATVTGTVNS
jgi:hypothetical protein